MHSPHDTLNVSQHASYSFMYLNNSDGAICLIRYAFPSALTSSLLNPYSTYKAMLIMIIRMGGNPINGVFLTSSNPGSACQ